MVELASLKIVQTVDFWIWAIIIGGFFFVPWKQRITLRGLQFRYIHCFAHLFIIMVFCCRGLPFDFYIVPVWVLLFFNWLWLSCRLHLAYDAMAAIQLDKRLDDHLGEFLLMEYSLKKYTYKVGEKNANGF